MGRRIIILTVSHIVVAVAFLILGYNMAPDATPPEIIRETQTVTRWKAGPAPSCDDLMACYRAPLDVSGRMDGDWLRVRCSDPCREAEKAFQMQCRADPPRNYAGAAALAIYTDGKIRFLGGGEYSRRIWGPIIVGGGAYSNGTDHAARVNAGATW